MRIGAIRKIIGATALVLAQLTVSGAFAHTLPITKLESRSWPQSAVVARVFGQLANALTTATASDGGADSDTPTEAEKRAVFAALQEAIAFDPGDVVRTTSGLPPADLVRRTLAHLSEIVSIWQDPTWRRHPRNELSQLTLDTRPSATSTPGLCVFFAITVRFRPVGPQRGPGTEVTATDADVEPYYYFPIPPAAPELGNASLAQRQKTQLQCPKPDVPGPGYFRADGAAQATRAAWLAKESIRLAASNTPGFPATCYYDKTGRECRRHLAAAKPFVAWVLGDCDTASCDLDVWGQGRLRIKWTAVPAPRVLSFDVDGDVIIADSVAD